MKRVCEIYCAMQDRPTQSSRGEQKAKHCWRGDVDLKQIVGVLLYLICEGAPIGIAADYKTANKHPSTHDWFHCGHL